MAGECLFFFLAQINKVSVRKLSHTVLIVKIYSSVYIKFHVMNLFYKLIIVKEIKQMLQLLWDGRKCGLLNLRTN